MQLLSDYPGIHFVYMIGLQPALYGRNLKVKHLRQIMQSISVLFLDLQNLSD